MNHENLQQWVGRNESHSDTIDLATCQRMEATLDQQPSLKTGEPLPPLWHWCWFHQPVRQSELGRDGHPKKGGFLPPVALPRRMWAGGRLTFIAPVPIGCKAQRASTIKSVESKNGRSGALCFVTVEHRIMVEGETVLIEEHDIVYRDDPKPGDKVATPPRSTFSGTDFSHTIRPSPVMMFRYSALTFNGHRIHYDRDYCHKVENYPGLVFHGPLTATLLADLAVRNNPDRQLQRFEFRAVSPIFDKDAFLLVGKMANNECELQAVLPGNGLAMRAQAVFA